jgi:hypothetical protein
MLDGNLQGTSWISERERLVSSLHTYYLIFADTRFKRLAAGDANTEKNGARICLEGSKVDA